MAVAASIVFSAAPGSDLIIAASGTTSLYSGSGFDSLYGVAGDFIDDSLSGSDLLVAGAGVETIDGLGADTIVAGTGNDFISSSGAGTNNLLEINAGFGNTTLASSSGSAGENIAFGTGIEPGSLAISAEQTGSTGNLSRDLSLVFADGSSSLVAQNGLFPNSIGNITFTDTGAETFDQLMRLDGPGTQSITVEGTAETLSTSDNQFIASAASSGIFAFGNNDTLGSPSSINGGVYVYGNADSVYSSGAGGVWLGGSNDLFSNSGQDVETTLAGANDSFVGSGGDLITVQNSSATVIETVEPGAPTIINAFVSYTLPTSVQELDLAAASLVGSSNTKAVHCWLIWISTR